MRGKMRRPSGDWLMPQIDDVVGGSSRVMSLAVEDDPAPALAFGLPQMVISRVDLPAPLEPMMVTIWPCSTSTLTPLQRLDVAVVGVDVLELRASAGPPSAARSAATSGGSSSSSGSPR